jgi:DNA-directed RNA polymerase specialized sigma24 family protein
MARVSLLPHRSPRQQAEAVANANYEALKQVVLRSVRSRLFARSVRLDQIDLEAAYNQAWHGVCQTIAQNRRVENLAGLLVDITCKRAIDIYRQRNEAMHADADVENHAVEVDLAERVDDQNKIERLLERLKDRLTDVQRNAVTLCVLQGYTRPEAARILGIEAAAFEKVMDRTMKKIGGIIAGMDSRGCGDDEWARALRSFALGLMSEDSPDYERIAEHVGECASCNRYVMGLRGLAAVLPPLGLPLAPVGHGSGALLAHLHKLFAPHGAGVAASAQTTGTVASGTAVGSATVTGGGWAVLGSGAAKVAVVVGLATVGTLSVHVLVTHHPTRHPRVATGRPSSSSTLPDEEGNGLQAAVLRREQRIHSERSQRPDGVKRRGRRVARSGAVAAEFGIEGPPAARSPARVPQPVATAGYTTSSRTMSAGPAEPSQSREFGFERGPS